MIIRKLHLDGYGRFTGREIDLSSGLQVVLGLNEQGKSTIRAFIPDLLYGQKASTTQRRYDDAQELRRPWEEMGTYAGRMIYDLDDGRRFEIHRNFDRQNESLQVFDLTHARDITAEFQMMRNREVDFAERHLGLSKTLFINVATIGHASLESLGDQDALDQIRERIISLTDSAQESASADSATKRLEAYIAAIGRPAAHSKRPLPTTRARLAMLDAELAQARAVQKEMDELERAFRAGRESIALMTERKRELEAQLDSAEQAERAAVLEEAERITSDIEALTRQCFRFAAGREFPVEREQEFQRALNAAETARQQLDRTCKELESQRRALDEKARALGTDGIEIRDIPQEDEDRLRELDTQVARLRDCLADMEKACKTVWEKITEAEAELEMLPDFGSLDSDPLAWMSQMANSFALALEKRRKERERLAALEAQRARRERFLEMPGRVFAQFDDFPREAEDFRISGRVFEERRSEQQRRVEQAQVTLSEFEEGLPGYRWASLLCVLATGVFLAIAHLTRVPGVYIAAAFGAIGLFYYLVNWVTSGTGSKRASRELEQAKDELSRGEEEHTQRALAMDAIIHEAGCESFRELEALFDRFEKDRETLDSLRLEIEQGRKTVQAEEEHVGRLFRKLAEVCADLGEPVAREADIQSALSRATAKYQRYHDAKRRLQENREQYNHLQIEADRLKEKLAGRQEAERRHSLAMRQVLRNVGYREEANHTSALSALRAYRIRAAQLKPKRTHVELLTERVRELEQQLSADEEQAEKTQAAVTRHLDETGADSPKAYLELAAQGRAYREARAKCAALEDKLQVMLRGRSLDELRACVQEVPDRRHAPERNAEALRCELDLLVEDLADRTKDAHALEMAITEHSAGTRPINDIEEERAAVQRKTDKLQLELDAAAHAAAVVEEVARAKHARIAPYLAQAASKHLREITGGKYSELLINRDLRITVRIPQTERLNENPERVLSKGTVDQIYLALRLALVQNLSAAGESIPMLLDDPFANYDDPRLGHALGLLRRFDTSQQIILFSCREDVARAAEELDVPVVRL